MSLFGRPGRLAPRAATRSSRNLWALGALLLVSAGVAGALLGAAILARGDARQSRSALRLAAQEVASNLRLRIDQENDLLVASAAFFKEEPAVGPARFRAWVSDVKAFKRYPELAGIADIVLVQRDRLARWEAHVASNPAPTGASQRFRLFPPGVRSHYCMTAASVSKLPHVVGLDSCALAPQLYASRSTGVTYDSVIALAPADRFLGASMPVYRGRSMARTTASRRARFIG